jgi:spore maturation protein CgeB
MVFKLLKDNETEDLVIAGILDEFSYNVFKYECNFINLNPLNYRRVLASTKIHFLFVESFWNGMDEQWEDLQKQTGESKIGIMKRIVKYCKKRDIPTVFWNKEDPIYFYIFKDMVKLFDFVFTTDANCIHAYTRLLGHNKVYVLPFAAQPVIHNPMDRNAERIGRVAFAGSWQADSPIDRKKDMDIVLKSAFKYDLSIYDRNYHRSLKCLRYPLDYEPYIKGGLPYNEILKIYKKYDIFLNVNSVQNSPTMFSRRIFELLACGTNVISGYAIGIEKLFSDIIPLCRTAADTDYYIEMMLADKDYRDKLSVLGQREVFKNHTCKHRLAYMLDCIGASYIREEQSGVTIIVWGDNLEDLQRGINNAYLQSYSHKEIIYITRNIEKKIGSMMNGINIKTILYDQCDTLEECIGNAINNSSYEYITFFHPQGYYAANFLTDLMNAFLYAEADIIGKNTYYAFAKDTEKLFMMYPNNEYRFSDYINPYAMVLKRSVLNKVKFMFKDDREFNIEMQIESNVKMYSSDRFNYVLEVESILPIESQDQIQDVGLFRQYQTFITV